ncbi:hypothetical protein PAE9249_03592 [Paenibacillus sp. CECT 9249]|nr:hypothetical protein PAE9249_03592 [Paenibacillus sp. CECT 9249]
MQISMFFGRIKTTFIIIPLMFLSVFPAAVNANSVNKEEMAKQSVNNYINAIQMGDVTEAVNWVIDTRFESINEQIEQYQEAISTDPFSNASLESIVSNSDSSFTVTLKLIRKENNEVNRVLLPVIKKEGEWKLLLDGQETMSDLVRKKIESERFSHRNTSQIMNDGMISPQASVYLGSYDEWLSKGGKTYSDKFDMTDLKIGISGYQYKPGFQDSVTAVYQVVKKGLFSDDVLGESIKTGYYPELPEYAKESFYQVLTLSNTNKPPSGVYLKVKNPSDNSGVAVKGWIYENQ